MEFLPTVFLFTALMILKKSRDDKLWDENEEKIKKEQIKKLEEENEKITKENDYNFESYVDEMKKKTKLMRVLCKKKWIRCDVCKKVVLDAEDVMITSSGKSFCSECDPGEEYDLLDSKMNPGGWVWHRGLMQD